MKFSFLFLLTFFDEGLTLFPQDRPVIGEIKNYTLEGNVITISNNSTDPPSTSTKCPIHHLPDGMIVRICNASFLQSATPPQISSSPLTSVAGKGNSRDGVDESLKENKKVLEVNKEERKTVSKDMVGVSPVVPQMEAPNSNKNQTGLVTGITASLCLAFAVFAYVGVLLWRRSLLKRYGNREELINEDELGDSNDADLHHFEGTTIQFTE